MKGRIEMVLTTTKMHEVPHTIPYTSDKFAASITGTIYHWNDQDKTWDRLDPNSEGKYNIEIRDDEFDRSLHRATMPASQLVYSVFFRVHPDSALIKDLGWVSEGNNPHPQLQNLINIFSKEEPVKNIGSLKIARLARQQVFRANNNLCEEYNSLTMFETMIEGLTKKVKDYETQISSIKLKSSIDENIYEALLTSLCHGLETMNDESFYKPLVHHAIDAMKVYAPNEAYYNYPDRVLLEDLPQYTISKDGFVYRRSDKLTFVEDRWHRKCVDLSNNSKNNSTTIKRVPVDVIMMNTFRKRDFPSFYTEQLVYHIDCDEDNNSIDNLCLEQDVDAALNTAKENKDEYEIAKWLRCKYHTLSRRLEQIETMKVACESETTSAYEILLDSIKHYIKCRESLYRGNHQNQDLDD